MITVTRRAPRGKFRVIGQDYRGDPGWIKGDYGTLKDAKKVALKYGRIKFFIYDDRGISQNLLDI